MKAVIQLGAAQLVVEGRTFAELCRDVEQALAPMISFSNQPQQQQQRRDDGAPHVVAPVFACSVGPPEDGIELIISTQKHFDEVEALIQTLQQREAAAAAANAALAALGRRPSSTTSSPRFACISSMAMLPRLTLAPQAHVAHVPAALGLDELLQSAPPVEPVRVSPHHNNNNNNKAMEDVEEDEVKSYPEYLLHLKSLHLPVDASSKGTSDVRHLSGTISPISTTDDSPSLPSPHAKLNASGSTPSLTGHPYHQQQQQQQQKSITFTFVAGGANNLSHHVEDGSPSRHPSHTEPPASSMESMGGNSITEVFVPAAHSTPRRRTAMERFLSPHDHEVVHQLLRAEDSSLQQHPASATSSPRGRTARVFCFVPTTTPTTATTTTTTATATTTPAPAASPAHPPTTTTATPSAPTAATHTATAAATTTATPTTTAATTTPTTAASPAHPPTTTTATPSAPAAASHTATAAATTATPTTTTTTTAAAATPTPATSPAHPPPPTATSTATAPAAPPPPSSAPATFRRPLFDAAVLDASLTAAGAAGRLLRRLRGRSPTVAASSTSTRAATYMMARPASAYTFRDRLNSSSRPTSSPPPRPPASPTSTSSPTLDAPPVWSTALVGGTRAGRTRPSSAMPYVHAPTRVRAAVIRGLYSGNNSPKAGAASVAAY